MTERITSLSEIEDEEKFLNAYYGAMEDAKTLRQANKELQAQVDAGSDEEIEKWKSRAIRAEAKVALESEGVKDAERIIKRLDLTGVDFDDDGSLTGFDEAVADFKADFPDLFDKNKRAGRKSADIHENKPAERELTPTERQAAALFG